MNKTLQDKYAALISRRHPHYSRLKEHWAFLEATYKGGRDWYSKNIFRYIKEGNREFEDRLARAYRFNHTRESVDLVQKYLFKMPVERNWDDAPAEIEKLWNSATLSDLDIDQFMRMVSLYASIFGRIWVFGDTTKRADTNASKADEAASKDRFHAYIVRPENVLDLAWSEEDGELTWILVEEHFRDDIDPLEGTGEILTRYRLWTRTSWFVFEQTADSSGQKTIAITKSGDNAIGRIPAFPVDHMIGEHKYSAPGLIDDIAYLDRAVANYLSNLDAIIQDQTFSQLAMPAQGLLPGDKDFDQLVEMGTKRIFTYDGESGAKPEFISPDPRQAQIIVTVVNKIINEIYHTVGMAGERTKEDNAVGIDNSSGVAKAYDFERVNALLTSKAASLENAENALIDLCMAYHSKAAPGDELVKYPDSFDVRSLFDEFAIAETLATVEAPVAVRRHQMQTLVDKMFPRVSAEVKALLKGDIDKWLDGVEPGFDKMPTRFPTASGNQPPPQKTLNANPRQGQVTKETGGAAKKKATA